MCSERMLIQTQTITHIFSLLSLAFLYRTHHDEATATHTARDMNAASRKGRFCVGYDCKWPSSKSLMKKIERLYSHADLQIG